MYSAFLILIGQFGEQPYSKLQLKIVWVTFWAGWAFICPWNIYQSSHRCNTTLCGISDLQWEFSWETNMLAFCSLPVSCSNENHSFSFQVDLFQLLRVCVILWCLLESVPKPWTETWGHLSMCYFCWSHDCGNPQVLFRPSVLLTRATALLKCAIFTRRWQEVLIFCLISLKWKWPSKTVGSIMFIIPALALSITG